MAELFMSPRSYTYSGGELIPYRERSDFGAAPSVAIGTEPTAPTAVPSATAPRSGGGFLAGLDRFAGTLAPFVEAAVAFKRGYDTGLPLPGRFGGPRMAGQEFIFQVLSDMRERNERAADRAREEREASRKADLRNQILLKAYENKEVSLGDLLKGLETGDLSVLDTPDKLPTQQPAATTPPPAASSPKSAPAAPAAPKPPADTRTSATTPKILYGEAAINPDFRGYI